MFIKSEITSIREFHFWSGAVDVYNRLVELDMVDEVDSFLECMMSEGEELTETQLNDFLWFDVPEFFENFTWKDK